MNETTTGFSAGVNAAMRGLSLVFSASGVRATYLQLVAVMLVVAGALDVLGIWAVLHYTEATPDAAWWSSIGLWVLRIAGIILILFVAAYVAFFIVTNAFPFLGQRVFMAAMRTLDPARAAELEASEGLSFSQGMADAARRFFLYIGLSLLAVASSFIPVAGAVLGPGLSAWFTARALGWELLDPWFDKLQWRYAEQRSFINDNRSTLFGFGLPLSLAMAIPLVGPFVFGAAQAAAAQLVSGVLDRRA